MPDEALQNNDKSWFSDVSWKAAVIYVALSVVAGGSTGAGLIATKAVAAQQPSVNGITQDQADVRYITKTEAETRRDTRDREIKEVKNSMLTREVFEAYHKADTDRMQRMENMIEKILSQSGR